MKLYRRLLALALAAAMLCASCAQAEPAQATAMRLQKTQGSVSLSDGEGKSLPPEEGMLLYSGYEMDTQTASYAWIDLDRVKLVKLDEESAAAIENDGKNLTVSVSRGQLFFNVTEPLADDETMNIRTSTMVVGIRGTCGWVDARDGEQVFILEGTVAVTAGEETVSVSAGEMARITVDGTGQPAIAVSEFTAADVPPFVLSELEEDEDLALEILEQSGLDVLNPPEEQPEETPSGDNDAAHTAYAMVLAEYLDAMENALPYDEYDPALEGNYEINREAFPNVGPAFLSFCLSGDDPIYFAYYDLDGNGVEELIIGVSWYDIMYLVEIHAFDGSGAVPVSASGGAPYLWVYYSAVTADGLLIETGNGATTSGNVYRLADDGYSLTPVTDSGIPGGVFEEDLDLSAHGGRLIDQLTWTRLDSDSLGAEISGASMGWIWLNGDFPNTGLEGTPLRTGLEPGAVR